MITPIVFATDDNYAMPTAVAIRSIVSHCSKKSLRFVILFQGSLNDSSIEMLEKAIEYSGFSNEIRFINVGDALQNAQSTIAHISVATFYRILLPNLLDNYNQCLYLDGDILVTDDICHLLDMELRDDEYIAGVNAVMVLSARNKAKEKLMKDLGITNLRDYVNAGVMLMNLEALRKNKCVEQMLDLIPRRFMMQDQDIMNKVCFEKKRILEPRYNAMPDVFSPIGLRSLIVYGLQAKRNAKQSPCIIHYADKSKPWKVKDIKNADRWYQQYSELFPGEELLRTNNGNKGVFSRIINKVTRK